MGIELRDEGDIFSEDDFSKLLVFLPYSDFERAASGSFSSTFTFFISFSKLLIEDDSCYLFSFSMLFIEEDSYCSSMFDNASC